MSGASFFSSLPRTRSLASETFGLWSRTNTRNRRWQIWIGLRWRGCSVSKHRQLINLQLLQLLMDPEQMRTDVVGNLPKYAKFPQLPQLFSKNPKTQIVLFYLFYPFVSQIALLDGKRSLNVNIFLKQFRR